MDEGLLFFIVFVFLDLFLLVGIFSWIQWRKKQFRTGLQALALQRAWKLSLENSQQIVIRSAELPSDWEVKILLRQKGKRHREFAFLNAAFTFSKEIKLPPESVFLMGPRMEGDYQKLKNAAPFMKKMLVTLLGPQMECLFKLQPYALPSYLAEKFTLLCSDEKSASEFLTSAREKAFMHLYDQFGKHSFPYLYQENQKLEIRFRRRPQSAEEVAQWVEACLLLSQ